MIHTHTKREREREIDRLYGKDISICGGLARPRGPGGSMKYIEIPVRIFTANVDTVCLNKLDSVCLTGQAGQGKPSRR